MDDHTSYIKATSFELRSYCNENEEASTLMYTGVSVPFMKLGQNIGDLNEGEAVYNELKATMAPVIVLANGKALLSTNKAIAEIAALKKVHGTPINEPSPERDAYVTKLAQGLKVTFVCRQYGDAIRALSTRSSKYGAIPMMTLKDVMDGFLSSDWVGSYEIKNWLMSQDAGAIYLELPKLANDMKKAYPHMPDNWIPGVIFSNGTTGYTTLSTTMTYRLGNNIYEVDNVPAKHFAGFDLNAYIKKMQNECWGKYTRMPEAFEKMTQVTIEDKDVETTIEKIFSFIKLNKVFQKKDTETCRYLENLRTRAYNDSKSFANPTLYDLVTMVMALPENVNVPESYQELLKTTCGKAWQYE